MKTVRSQELLAEALRLIPGGVNSPVRAFKSVGGQPLFIDRGKGPYIWDVDGNRFVDYVLSWGPLILGHAPDGVLARLVEVAAKGTSFGAPTEAEVVLARMIAEAYPSMEMVRLVNSGTEATMSALRLARAITGRDKILKFDGCYHGHADSLLVKAGSGVATLGLPDSPGVPAALAEQTLTAEYNNLDSVERFFRACPKEIACVIVEPVAGNMGVVPPEPGFLEGLRALATGYGALLIFDEVMTGFRVAYGGAQELYGITPDLTCLGKVIGGGLPVGAYGGKADYLDKVAPAGPVYQAGTLSGNPLAVAAGIATLEVLRRPETYDTLAKIGDALATGLKNICDQASVPTYRTRVGTMSCLFFTEGPVRNFSEAKKSDSSRYAAFFRTCLENGVSFAPSQFEAAFISTTHDEKAIQETLSAVETAMKEL